MHTVRNRAASTPRPPRKATPPARARKRREPPFMLQHGNPPAFPAGLIVPPPRGAVIATVPWPLLPVEASARSGAEKPKRVRKAASSPKASGPRKPRKSSVGKSRAVPGKAKAAPRAATQQPTSITQDTAIPMTNADLLDRALAMQSETADATLPAAIQPPAPATPPPAAGATPLPRSRSLAHPRSHALLDVIGYWLRDAGRWLSRWSSGKSQARSMVARANARHCAMQSQIEALEALREVARAD